MVNNPYTEMLISSRPDRVFGRDRDLGYILRNITQRTPSSIAISGPRTMGKTTLLHQIKAVAESRELLRAQGAWVGDDFRPGEEDSEDAAPRRELVAVYVDLEGIHRPHPQDVFGLLLRQLRAEALISGRFKAGGDLPVPERNDSGEVAFDKLREALIRLDSPEDDTHRTDRAVFLLDNFDDVIEKARTPLDSQLRSLRMYAAFVVAFEKPPTEADSFLLGITYDVTLGALDDEAARQLIRQSPEFGPAEEDFLVRVSGRQPFLLVTACAALLDLYQLDGVSMLSVRGAEAASKEFEAQFTSYLLLQRTVEQALRRLWGHLTDAEQRAAWLLADGKDLDPTARRTVLPGLRDKGAAPGIGGPPRLFSSLFAEYVRRQAEEVAPPLASTPPVYEEIGRSLGPKDRAVLRYILDRPNQLITFDELLNGFWGPGDNRSRERKRRLDVAIHRIRTAMEGRGLDGPTHLRNLRGKGFEFIP